MQQHFTAAEIITSLKYSRVFSCVYKLKLHLEIVYYLILTFTVFRNVSDPIKYVQNLYLRNKLVTSRFARAYEDQYRVPHRN